MANIDKHEAGQAIANHPGFIVGLKARMSSSVVGENGITPLERAKAIQKENGELPLMVHIGNNPPNLDEIAELLTPWRHHHPLLQRQTEPHSDAGGQAARLHPARAAARRAAGRGARHRQLQL